MHYSINISNLYGKLAVAIKHLFYIIAVLLSTMIYMGFRNSNDVINMKVSRGFKTVYYFLS